MGTKLALVRTLQDKNQAQQARDERFHEFFATREPFGELVIQAAACERRHMDNNTSWVVAGELSAISSTVTYSIGRLFVQVGIFDPRDKEHGPLTRFQLAAVRQLSKGKVQLVREGRLWTANGVLSETELMMAREPAALIGAAAAVENSMERTPIKKSRGGSFGNPYGVPNINTLQWRTYGSEMP